MKRLITLLIFLVFFTFIIGCNKNITTTGDNDNSLKFQMENKNFKFYSFDKDKNCINDLAKTLDENYDRISKDLKVTLKDKVEIEIYPDIKSYHNSAGLQNAADWIVGTALGNKIKMVSPLNPGGQHTYDSLMQVVVHEFTHVVTSNINADTNSIPMWLNEGIATYEAKQIPNDRIYFKGMLDNDKILSLSEMIPTNFSAVGGYAFSYIAIEYLIKNYGYNTVISLIETPANLEKILGVSLIEFENNWRAYLKENYI